MEKVKRSDFKISLDINSVRREEMSDETYFSSTYKNYISNSRLKWIDPSANGSPVLFQNPPKLSTDSLRIGSCIHECLLQPEEFELGPKIGKPTAKLGSVMDAIPDFLKEGIGLNDAIKQAALKVDYFSSNVDSKIEAIKEVWNQYSIGLNQLNPTNKTRRIVSDKDWDVINSCLQSCTSNEEIMNLLHPTNPFGDPIESYCEDAFFADYIVLYKNKYGTSLPFKMKADNWTIDPDTKLITLNDLKTTSHPVQNFMKTDIGSFVHYSYGRQMAAYGQILINYALKKYGASIMDGWKFEANMLVVETIPNYWSRAYKVNPSQLTEGRKMLNDLLCRVAYCQIFGWDKEIEFV